MKKDNLSYLQPTEANNLRKERRKQKKHKKKPLKQKFQKRREKKPHFGIKDYDENLETEVVFVREKSSRVYLDSEFIIIIMKILIKVYLFK